MTFRFDSYLSKCIIHYSSCHVISRSDLSLTCVRIIIICSSFQFCRHFQAFFAPQPCLATPEIYRAPRQDRFHGATMLSKRPNSIFTRFLIRFSSITCREKITVAHGPQHKSFSTCPSHFALL